MNKNEFINQLDKKLKSLPNEEREDALKYYEEYFEEARISEDEDVLGELAHPSEIASQLLSEYAVKGVDLNKTSIKKSVSSIWFIILAILVSPLALPIALPIIIFIFVAVILVSVFSFVFVVVSGTLIVSGFSVFIRGLGNIFFNFTAAITDIGVGLILIGVTIVVVVGIFILMSKLFRIIIKSLSNALNKYKASKK